MRDRWGGWLYGTSRPMSAASGTGQPRIRVMWPRRHAVTGRHAREFDVAVRGTLNTRMCVLHATAISSTALRDAPPKHRSTLSLTIIQPLSRG